VIGRYPKELMNILYTGLLGTNVDPDQIKKVFNDDGLQQSSIMTLYYVQVAATIEASDLQLTLPRGFPNGWGEDRGHRHTTGDDLVQSSSSMLTLTVSKLQQGVSNTFNSIGFDHVLEHVIDSNDIQDEYGIQLPQAQKEFLSIDIASVDKRIGIEVDGPGHFVRLIDKPGKSSTTKHQFDDLGENRFNGPTILKHRLLGHLGWNIIHVSYNLCYRMPVCHCSLGVFLIASLPYYSYHIGSIKKCKVIQLKRWTIARAYSRPIKTNKNKLKVLITID